MSETVQVIAPPVRDPERERLRRRRAFWRKSLAVVILAVIVGFGALMSITRTNPMQAFQLLTGGAHLLRQHVAPEPPFGGKSHVNILVLGVDVSFDDSGTARTDTIKLVSLDLDKSRVAILSIPRDTWVSIPGHGHSRINAAFQLGGKEDAERIAFARTTVAEYLSELYGAPVPIDHYVRIQTGGFIKIVDAIGGVTVDVEKRMDYTDASQELYIDLQPGLQRLNGEQAMGYVRFRMDAEGDYGRIRRQDQFIRALAQEVQREDSRLQLAQAVGPIMTMLKTDIREHDIVAVKDILSQVGVEGIHAMQLPTVPVTKGRAMVVEVQDTDAASQTIAELLHGPRTTVAVLNGSERRGLAQDVRDVIDATRYNILAAGTTVEPVAASSIITVPRCREHADALARTLGITTVVTEGAPPEATFGRSPTPPPAEVTVVLGTDYQPRPDAETHAQAPH